MLKQFPLQSAARWGSLPSRMSVLAITGHPNFARRLVAAFADDNATEVDLTEAVGMAAGLTRLRDEAFDAILVHHDPSVLDAVQFLEALRAGDGEQQALVVIGTRVATEMNVLCFEAGADGYVRVPEATTRELIWQLYRAMERRALLVANRRLEKEQQHRLRGEHDEATRLLAQQRGLIADLEKLRPGNHACEASLPGGAQSKLDLSEHFVTHYRELLRAYVIMGSGNLAGEMQRLASSLTDSGISAQQAMHMHLLVLEDVVRSLGSRSARHVMNRADILILEVMMHLCDVYRGQAATEPLHLSRRAV